MNRYIMIHFKAMSIDAHSLLFWLFIWSQLYSYVMILGANSALNGLGVTLVRVWVKSG